MTLDELKDKWRSDGWFIGTLNDAPGLFAYYGAIGGKPLILRDPTADGLDLRIAEFLRVFGATHDRYAAQAAAGELET